MEIQTEAQSLVSFLNGMLSSGLEALQKGGWTIRLWRRIATDREFQDAVGIATEELDISMAGGKHVLTFQPGDCRKELLRQINEIYKNRSIALREDWIMRLSTDGKKLKCLPGTFTQEQQITLFTTYVGYRMKPAEIAEELASRRLVSANTEEALLFFLHRRGWMPQDNPIFVPGAQLFEGGSYQMLDLSRVLDGTPNMSLWEVKQGIPGGSYLLTRRAAFRA